MEIFHEGTDALIENGKIFLLAHKDRVVGSPLDIPATVPVPFAVIQGDHANSRFDQASSYQHALRHTRCTVAIHEDRWVTHPVTFNHFGIFFGKIKGFC
jgi:hypothetical protein